MCFRLSSFPKRPVKNAVPDAYAFAGVAAATAAVAAAGALLLGEGIRNTR